MKPSKQQGRATPSPRGPQPAEPDDPETWLLPKHHVSMYGYWARRGSKVATERLALHNKVMAELDTQRDSHTPPDTAA